nr:hypothetical protein [Tanacetum cinerariifolium]
MSSYNHFGCSWCGGPFNGGNCPGCSSVGSGNEFVYDPNSYSYNETPNFFNQPQHHQYETYSCELCGDSPHYGFDCQTRTPLVYEQEPCYNQNFSDNYYPQNSSSFPQQDLCCENCGGPHVTFQCQPLNQNFYEPNHCYKSNSFGFDQSQPPQLPVIHQPPQETSIEILHDQENEINSDRVFTIKDALGNKRYKPEDIQELFRELFNDVQNIHEELAEYINTPSWNRPAFEDDDEDYAITPDFLITDSLSMGDEHLDTISAMESDEFIKSSVENLVSNPSKFEDECECDVPDCDDSQTTNFSTFSNPLFDDFTFSDDKSSHEEVIYEMSFKTYSNPLFDLDEKIISSEFNPIHNEDLDSTPKNNRFDSKSYLLESFLNFDESIPLGIDNDDSDSEEDNLFLERLLHDDHIPLPDTLDFSYDVRVFLPFFTYPVTSLILLSSGSEDTIFDPGIYRFSSLEPGLSHRCGIL